MTFLKFLDIQGIRLTPWQYAVATELIEKINSSPIIADEMSECGRGVTMMFNLIESYYKTHSHHLK